MRSLKNIIFIALLATTNFALAEPNAPLLKFELNPAHGAATTPAATLQFEVGYADSNAEAEVLVHHFREQTQALKASAGSPLFAGSFVDSSASTETRALQHYYTAITDLPSQPVALDKLDTQGLGQDFLKWLKTGNRYKWTFTLVRLVINSSVTSWGFYSQAKLPLEIALTAGIFTGALSSSTQFFNKQLQDWLLKKGLLQKHLSASTDKGRLLLAKGDEYTRYYFAESIFVGCVKGTLHLLGASHEGLLSATLATLHTGAKSLFGQGTWDLANANYKKAKISADPNMADSIQFKSDLTTLGISISSVALSSLDVLGLKIGSVGLYLMGGTGLLAYIAALNQDRLAELKAKVCGLGLVKR